MQQRRTVWLLASLYFLLMVVAASTSFAQGGLETKGEVIVWGRVLDNATQEPVDQAVVKLQGMTLRQETRTDGRGKFTFQRILPGSYTITVIADGYQVAREPLSVLEAMPQTLNSTYNPVVRLRRLPEGQEQSPETNVALRQLQVPKKARKEFERGSEELHRKKKPERSLKYFRKAIEIYPDFDDAYVQLGLAHLLQNRTDEALQAFKKAIDIYPDNPHAHALLGKILVQQGQLEEGIRALTTAVELNGQAWSVRLDLGRALLQAGRIEEAYQHAKHAREINPASMNVHLLYYNALAQRGDYAEALEELDAFLKLYPDTPAAQQMESMRGGLARAAAETKTP
jgi:tetratricopeptide (TPR) repeat protein